MSDARPFLVLTLLLGACASGGNQVPPVEAPPRPAPSVEAPVSRSAGPLAAMPAEPAEAAAPVETGGEAPAPGASEPSATADELPVDPPVGSVAGAPIRAEELLEEWHDLSSREVWLVVERVVATRLAVAEARRLGIRLDEALLEERLGLERDELQAEMDRRGLDLSLEAFVRQELMREPGHYLERLRQATLRQMLAERSVRAGSLATESVACRVIVVPDDETLAKVQGELETGRDFAEVAQEHSVDDSAADGGFVPFVVRQEYSPLARLAFQTPAGETGGPLLAGKHRFLVKVEEHRAPLTGPWSQVGTAVEASLARYPVTDSEFLHWKLTMEERYPIDLEPLRALLGATR